MVRKDHVVVIPVARSCLQRAMTRSRVVTHPRGEPSMTTSATRRLRGLLGLATAVALAGGTLAAGDASAAAAPRPAGLARGPAPRGPRAAPCGGSGALGADARVPAAVRTSGGSSVRALGIVHGVSADVPA